ncbi:cysteinyl-tRNA synthetase [Sorochytrium milnesiophthora]
MSTKAVESPAVSKQQQPPWHKPQAGDSTPKLRLLNTLTHKKEEFVPVNGKHVTWYNCGPTVYDSAHIGHGRFYTTVDIIRRVLEEYFNYDVHLVMNITDVDDKIILRTRHNHLFDEHVRDAVAKGGLTASLLEKTKQGWAHFTKDEFGQDAVQDWRAYFAANRDRQTGDIEKDYKFKLKLNYTNEAFEAIEASQSRLASKTADASAEAGVRDLLEANRPILSLALDKELGHTVTDPQLFRKLAAHWENDFMEDMRSLGIRQPDIITRVSEYLPEIVTFVETIISNGYAYETEGSVYFDTKAFHNAPDHSYAKLEPWSANFSEKTAEGEGDLSVNLTSAKRSPADFALWKRSKSGEPAWPSPWGEGRPGWHIECSVMSGAIFGGKMDIHSGGVDLAFPHHDNEIAQSEAHYQCDQWTNYFLHIGHLHIEGLKMSKSLKNFTTIKETLQTYRVGLVRMLFLLHSWEATLDFKQSSVQEARAAEATFNNFITAVKALLHEDQLKPFVFSSTHNFQALEATLFAELQQVQTDVHAALCDNIDTATAISKLLDLVNRANVYLKQVRAESRDPNAQLLRNVARYVTRMTRIFGLTDSGADVAFGLASSSDAGSVQNREELLMPYLHTLSRFRDEVREGARAKKEPSFFLSLSDRVRDVDLVDLGVSLDDRDDGKALVKLVDKELLLQQREEKRVREAERVAAKQKQARAAELKRLKQLYEGIKSPQALVEQGGEYSAYDEQGVPTHDKEGAELPKSKRKKLAKDLDRQKKLHGDYLKEVAKGPVDWTALKEEFAATGQAFELD